MPEAYGGAPMSYRLYLAVVQTISEACASTGIIYATSFHGIKPLIDFGTEEQKKRLLPRVAGGALASLAITEAVAGSDATAMKMRFTPDGDDIIVDGGKLFITSGDVADLLLVFGKWSAIEDPKQAISALIIEKGVPGFEVVRVKKSSVTAPHLRWSSPSTVAGFRARSLLGQPGEGLALLLAALNKSRPSIAAHALGIATAAFKDMVAYMNTRAVAKRHVIDFQANQFLIADLAAELAMTELWLDDVASLIDGAAVDFGLRGLDCQAAGQRSGHAHDD